MNQQIKFMTVEEFMNTMKRRGTADTAKIEINLPSPATFKRQLDKKHTTYQKQMGVLQKLSQKNLVNQKNFNHYFINEGVNKSSQALNSQTNINFGVSSEQTNQGLRESDADYQNSTQLNNSQFHIRSNQFIPQEDYLKTQQNIVNEIQKNYKKQRFYSPPYEKRDLDNLEEYFKRSKNYQTMNKLIRKNSCECLKCGGKQNRMQNMKGFIPQFIPRQIIRDSLRKKWKKASKTLRKLCFFFKLAAGGHTKPRNGILKGKIARQKTGLNISTGSNMQTSISPMLSSIQSNIYSNENPRSKGSGDTYIPPFLNLKSENSNPQVDLDLNKSQSITTEANKPITKKIEIITKTNDTAQLPLVETPADCNSNSSNSSFDQKDIDSPSQIRKALNKVDRNFIKELTITRDMQRQKSKKVTSLKRNNASKKTQSFYNFYFSGQSQYLEQSPMHQLSKQKIQTAYQKFFVKPHQKLVEIVNQKSESIQNSPNNLPQIQQLGQLSKSQSSKSAFIVQSSPIGSPQSYLSKSKFEYTNNSNKFFKRSDYYTDRKKSVETIFLDDSQNQSFAETKKNLNENLDQIKIKKISENNSAIDYFSSSPRHNTEDSVLSKNKIKRIQNRSMNSSQGKHFFDVYSGNPRSNSINQSLQNNSSPKNKKILEAFDLSDRIKQSTPTEESLSQKRVKTQACTRNQLLKNYKDKIPQSNAVEGRFAQKIAQSKLDKHQLRVFEKKDIKSIQQDINHLRLRSLYLCKNKDSVSNQQESQVKILPQKQQIQNNSSMNSMSKRFQMKDSQDPLNFMNLSQNMKEDEDQLPNILKKQTLKNTQSNNQQYQI